MKTEQLSFSEAKRLSIKKWKMLADAGGYSKEVFEDEELNPLFNCCGFCERWMFECEKCEFGKIAGECTDKGSLFSKWTWKHTKYRTNKILNVIKNLEE